MKIAICDDEQREIDLLLQYISQYDANIQTKSFLSANNLLQSFNEEFFEIVFLDIEMDGLNGFQAAQILMDRKDTPLIIFVTNSNEYTIRGYGIAFRYLQKPIDYNTLSIVLNAAIQTVKPQKISFIENGSTVILSVNDIKFIESLTNTVSIHATERHETRMSLTALEESLIDCSFSRSHKSYLVNLKHIKTVTANKILMIDNTDIPIGKKYKSSFEIELQRFLRE